MRLALCNASLPAGAHGAWLPRLGEMGLQGLEVVPAATWDETWYGLSAGQVSRYGRQVRQAGLEVLGLQLSLAEHPGLGWFGDEQSSKETLAYLTHLSSVCRDLGGRTLVIGEGRWREGLDLPRAWRRSLAFFQDLCQRIEAHGTVVCLAPLGPLEGDFCNGAMDCRILADAVDHPALGLQLNARALVESGEMGRHSVFASHYGRLELFVADEPGLLPLGSSQRVDHSAMRRHLSAGGYRGWVCLSQRPTWGGLDDSVALLSRYYLRQDNLSLLLHQQARAAGSRPA